MMKKNEGGIHNEGGRWVYINFGESDGRYVSNHSLTNTIFFFFFLWPFRFAHELSLSHAREFRNNITFASQWTRIL